MIRHPAVAAALLASVAHLAGIDPDAGGVDPGGAPGGLRNNPEVRRLGSCQYQYTCGTKTCMCVGIGGNDVMFACKSARSGVASVSACTKC